GIAEQAELRDLGVAGAEITLRQSVEQRGIGDHQDRLMEGAGEILAVARVDAGLAADRGVDLRQQGGGHLHDMQAAWTDPGVGAAAGGRRPPPPGAVTTSLRPVGASSRRSHSSSSRAQLFVASPGGSTIAVARIPAAASAASAAARWRAATVASVTIAAAAPG